MWKGALHFRVRSQHPGQPDKDLALWESAGDPAGCYPARARFTCLGGSVGGIKEDVSDSGRGRLGRGHAYSQLRPSWTLSVGAMLA